MRLTVAVLALLVGIASGARSEEIFGTVASVDGYRVRITLEEVVRVREGDSVQLSSEIPGVGRVAIEGEWKVVEIGTGYVVADVEGEASGTPQPGYRAAVEATGSLPAPGKPAPPPAEAKRSTPPQRSPQAQPPQQAEPVRPYGVYLAGFESGSKPVWWPIENAIRGLLTEHGTRLLELPSDLPYPRTAAPSPARVHQDLQRYGGGWLLYLTVANATGAWGKAGKDRVTIECFGPSGQSHWQESTSFRLNAGRTRVAAKKRVNLLIQAMRKHSGGPCLRP